MGSNPKSGSTPREPLMGFNVSEGRRCLEASAGALEVDAKASQPPPRCPSVYS